MSVTFIATAAVCTVAAVLVTGHRVVGIRRILQHPTLVDVGFSVAMVVAFAGTLTGMLVAIIAGLLMALVLSAGRYLLRFERPTTARDSEYNDKGEWLYNTAPYVN